MQVNEPALPGSDGYVYPARARVTSPTSFASLKASIISRAYDEDFITRNLKAPRHVRRAARLSFDQASGALALISILGACHTLNTM